MSYVLWGLGVLIAIIFLLGLYGVYVVYRGAGISKELIAQATPFTLHTETAGNSLLVLGDSSAVGVGATAAEHSVPGILSAKERFVYVENHAFSGARVSDLAQQIERAERREYSSILIMIGGNDIIRFKSGARAADELAEALKALPRGKEVRVLSAGNVGGATLFPWYLRPLYHQLSLSYHHAFERVVTPAGYTYINLYEDPTRDPFIREPKVYLAKDGLHPSDQGYALWADRIVGQSVR